MIYNIKTDKPMSSIKAYITGRTISYNGTSSIRFKLSDTLTGIYTEVAGYISTNSDLASDQYFSSEKEFSLSTGKL
jgi:hypothetical protein